MSKSSHFHWTTNKVTNNNDENDQNQSSSSSKNPQNPTKILNPKNPNLPKNPEASTEIPKPKNPNNLPKSYKLAAQRRKLQAITVSRLRSVINTFSRSGSHFPSKVTGTLFGRRGGNVHFALQKDPTSEPSFLVELATPISFLVREMASGLVRIALECDRAPPPARRLTEEVTWRAYCNGKRCGFASRRESGERERRVLKAVEMVSMGAGVLPGGGERKDEEEVMYMRAKFERVVGGRDSEAFYMMNPDSNGAPELSIYLLRV